MILADSFYLNDKYYHSKGKSFAHMEGEYSEYYAEELGLFNIRHHDVWSMGDLRLIQAIIYDSVGNIIFHDYTVNPQIVFSSVTQTKDSVLVYDFIVDHAYSVDTSTMVAIPLNFISEVKMDGFYSRGSDSIGFNTAYAANVYGTKRFHLITPIDLSLLKNNFKLNYRLTAKDKGIIPHYDYNPSQSTYYTLVFDTTTNIEEEENLIAEFKLFQNYPNPFNPLTRIQYQVASSSHVTLKVYDVLGNEVATLVDEYKPAGSYEVEFQSTVGSHQLASGVYFYQLKAGELVQTKKMILLR